MFTAAVIGLGQVGQGYDYYSRGSILTHASAYQAHPGFQLVAGADGDPLSRMKFSEKYAMEAFEDCSSLKGSFPHVDIVSIAVPTTGHFAVFKEVMELTPRVVFCEKPIAGTVEEACEMKRLAREANCAVAVNYTRRFLPQICLARQSILDGGIGEVYKGIGWYTKGIVHCGSHFIDLLMDFMGIPDEINVLEKGRMWQGQDPEPDIELKFGCAKIFLLSGREECFSMGEIELVGTEGRFIYRDGESLRVYQKQEDPMYPGHQSLRKPQLLNVAWERSMSFPVVNIYESLTNGSPLLSNDDTAIETLRVLETIKEKVELAYE